MRREVQADLIEVVRRVARPATLEELQSRGVRKVRSVELEAISLLIERAVNRTLMRRTIGGIDEAEVHALAAETDAELARQLAAVARSADSRGLIEAHRESVRAELAALRASIAERERRAPPDSASSASEDAASATELRLKVQALLLPLLDAGSGRRPGVRRTAERLAALFAEDKAAALALQRRALEADVDVLERRVAKLVESLEATERVLEEVARMKGIEHGIASIYRTVQGLAANALEREKKRAMRERIFLSNVELQRTLAHA
jgi:hypothetical protein